jgi:hypothetical protein
MGCDRFIKLIRLERLEIWVFLFKAIYIDLSIFFFNFGLLCKFEDLFINFRICINK